MSGAAKGRRRAGILSLAAAACAVWIGGPRSAAAQATKEEASGAGIEWVPLTFREVSGVRPFVPVEMNGKAFLLMVHANANFYAQTTHANAAAAGLTNLGKESDYGIEKDGKVSELGRTTATLASLKVGTKEAKNVRLSVFEVPQTPEMNGMLGTGWLREQKAIVDFDAYRLGLPDSAAAAAEADKRLEARGYTGHKMTWDAERHVWFVMGKVDGHAIRWCVSTVAEVVIDSAWARANGVELGPVIDQQGGPAGALVDESIVKRMARITVDGQECPPMQAVSWDLFEYSSAKRESGSYNEGFLGAEFMLANQAVIDFGTEMVFLAKWEGGK